MWKTLVLCGRESKPKKKRNKNLAIRLLLCTANRSHPLFSPFFTRNCFLRLLPLRFDHFWAHWARVEKKTLWGYFCKKMRKCVEYFFFCFVFFRFFCSFWSFSVRSNLSKSYFCMSFFLFCLFANERYSPRPIYLYFVHSFVPRNHKNFCVKNKKNKKK